MTNASEDIGSWSLCAAGWDVKMIHSFWKQLDSLKLNTNSRIQHSSDTLGHLSQKETYVTQKCVNKQA